MPSFTIPNYEKKIKSLLGSELHTEIMTAYEEGTVSEYEKYNTVMRSLLDRIVSGVKYTDDYDGVEYKTTTDTQEFQIKDEFLGVIAEAKDDANKVYKRIIMLINAYTGEAEGYHTIHEEEPYTYTPNYF